MWLVGGCVLLHNALSISTETEWELRALSTQHRKTLQWRGRTQCLANTKFQNLKYYEVLRPLANG